MSPATVNGVTNGLLSGDEIRALEGLDDWRSMYDAIEARFRRRNFATGLEFVNRIGEAAEAADHHPDISLSYTCVSIALTSHDVGGKTQRDVDLARQISEIAADLGVARRRSRRHHRVHRRGSELHGARRPRKATRSASVHTSDAATDASSARPYIVSFNRRLALAPRTFPSGLDRSNVPYLRWVVAVRESVILSGCSRCSSLFVPLVVSAGPLVISNLERVRGRLGASSFRIDEPLANSLMVRQA